MMGRSRITSNTAQKKLDKCQQPMEVGNEPIRLKSETGSTKKREEETAVQ